MRLVVDRIGGERYVALIIGQTYAIVWLEWPLAVHVGHTKRPNIHRKEADRDSRGTRR